MDRTAATPDGDDLLVRRLRVGLAITVGGITAFVLADLKFQPAHAGALLGIQAVELAVMLCAIWLLGRPMSRARVIAAALVTTCMLAFTTALSGVLSGDAGTAILMLTLLTMGTATLLPWGVRPQLVLQAVASLAVVWNVYAVNGPDMALRSLLVGAVIGFAGALYAAHTLEQQRLDRARAEALLEQARERQHRAELEHAARLSTLGEMAAGLAHEINQPLAAIVSYATGCMVRLETGTATIESLTPVVREICDEAMRAGEVLRRIRDFSRHGTRRLERVDPNELVRSALQLASGDARRFAVSMSVDLRPGAPVVEVDRVQVEQVILNLLRNAFEAMDDPGRSDRRLRVETSTPSPGVVEVAVGDSGAGLPAAASAQVFDPFFTTKRDGLGLGLAISRRIVEAHGGRLWSTPNPDRGTTFRFSLPTVADVA
jgi:signal transduction histidine kinase